jgi:adenylate kinase family enzyme
MKRDFVIIHLALSKEQALDRMIKRATIEWRKDDTPEAMEQRIDIFIHQTLRVIKHFEKLWKVITIDANGSIESIQEQLKYQLWL